MKKSILTILVATMTGCMASTEAEDLGQVQEAVTADNTLCAKVQLENRFIDVVVKNDNLIKLDAVAPDTAMRIRITASPCSETRPNFYAYYSYIQTINTKKDPANTNAWVDLSSAKTPEITSPRNIKGTGKLNIHINIAKYTDPPVAASDAGSIADTGSSTQDAGSSNQDAGTSSSKAPLAAPVVPLLPSCVGDPKLPDGTSLCQSLPVPGGTVLRGRSSTGSDSCSKSPVGFDCFYDNLPEVVMTVDGFSLDTFEVTVARFRNFVTSFNGTLPAANAGAHPKIQGSGWDARFNAFMPTSQALLMKNLRSCDFSTWTDTTGTNEGKPINCVSWYEATAFCAWDGGRLPTATEWEYAAAGGMENRFYPWGSEAPTSKHAVFGFNYSGGVYSKAAIAPVGTTPLGRSKWGHFDMAGSMWELLMDAHDVRTAAQGGSDDYTLVPATNPANVLYYAPVDVKSREVRGGGFGKNLDALTVPQRSDFRAVDRQRDIGFRCAR